MKLAALSAFGLATAKWSPGSVDASDKPLVILYYDEWAKWSQFFSVYQMERMILSRQMPVRNWVINYSFLTYSAQSCRLVPTDAEVAWSSPETQMFPGSGWWDQNSIYGKPAGAMPALLALRQKYPYVKFLFSVGGWSASHTFSDCLRTGMGSMIASAMDFVYYFDFDGIDLDWEHPACPLDEDPEDPRKQNGKCGCQGETTCYDPEKGYYTPNKGRISDWEFYKVFVQQLRSQFDGMEDSMQKKLYITAALGMSPLLIDGDGDIYKVPLPVEWICDNDYFDWVNLMTYDFYGPWSPKTGHLSPLYKSTGKDVDEDQISIDESIQKILARCSRPEKLVMGLAAYGKGWANVPNSGTVPGLWQISENKMTNVIEANKTYGPKMTFEQGTVTYWDIKYNYLTNPNCKRTYDNEAKAPTLYCTKISEPQFAGQDSLANDVFISYDDAESWEDRMYYARSHGMAGAIIWAASNSGHEAHADGSAQTHDGVEDLYEGLFKGWYRSDNHIGKIGANGVYSFVGIEANELPNSSTCPYGTGSYRSQDFVYNACYDDGAPFDYLNTKYPKKSGFGTQDKIGQDVILISPVPRLPATTTAAPVTCPTCAPGPTCPPPATAPTCPPPATCPACPTQAAAPTCPPPATAPTCPPSPTVPTCPPVTACPTEPAHDREAELKACQNTKFAGIADAMCKTVCFAFYTRPCHPELTVAECVLLTMPDCAP